MWNRAAQFAPFAALTGYDAAIQESGRFTDNWVGLSESGNEEMNHKMGFYKNLCGLVQLQVTMEEQNGSSKSLGCGISSSDSSDFLY